MSQHDWMIRVLDDLAAYARENAMPALAEHLAQARLLAITEIANAGDDDDDQAHR